MRPQKLVSLNSIRLPINHLKLHSSPFSPAGIKVVGECLAAWDCMSECVNKKRKESGIENSLPLSTHILMFSPFFIMATISSLILISCISHDKCYSTKKHVKMFSALNHSSHNHWDIIRDESPSAWTDTDPMINKPVDAKSIHLDVQASNRAKSCPSVAIFKHQLLKWVSLCGEQQMSLCLHLPLLKNSTAQ